MSNTNNVIPPTCEEICNGDLFHCVDRQMEQWRHGVIIDEVYERIKDRSFWRVVYKVSNDGETNDLINGTAKIYRVVPIKKEITDYIPWSTQYLSDPKYLSVKY